LNKTQLIRDFILKINSSASFWNVVYNSLRIGGNILTLPIALRMLPESEMGLYYTFSAVSGLTAFLDMGLGGTVARQVNYINSGATEIVSDGVPQSHPEGIANMHLFSQTVGTIRNIYTILGIIAFVLLIVPGSIFIGGNISKAGMSTAFLGAWVLYALSASHALGTGFWNNFLMGIKEQRLSGVIGSSMQAGYVLIVLLGLLSGWGIWAYAIALLVSGYVQRSISKHFFLKKSKVKLGSKPNYSIIHKLWPMSWRLAIVLLCMYAFQKACVIVSSQELGLQATSSFGLAISLFTIVFQVTRSRLYIKYPEITQLRVKGDFRKIKTIFFSNVYSYLGIMTCILGMIIISGPQILMIMGSKTQMPDTSVLIVMALFFIIDRHQDEYLTLVLTENKNPFIIPYSITAIISVLLMILGAKKYGLMGLVIGQGISTLIINNWWVVLRGLKGISSESHPRVCS
jgi:O-antigen/teichoic acid export membrane protein